MRGSAWRKTTTKQQEPLGTNVKYLMSCRTLTGQCWSFQWTCCCALLASNSKAGLYPAFCIYILSTFIEQLDTENQSLFKCGFSHYTMDEYVKETVLSTILPVQGEWHAPSPQACSCPGSSLEEQRSCTCGCWTQRGISGSVVTSKLPCTGWELQEALLTAWCCVHLCKNNDRKWALGQGCQFGAEMGTSGTAPYFREHWDPPVFACKMAEA